ncbi:alpha-L-fucosidase [Compostibacter hankyongensis]|uniref:alpha-L-fucosidase n=1 Tax=Compostibacter hankyongensis TaxID=1007089 RepID=A0ABP8FL73_9BACT
MKRFLWGAIFLLLTGGQTRAQSNAPAPFGPLPSARQLQWQQMGYYMFVHFNMNTFTGKEWGEGSESPELFNPTALDCRQWARIAKAAGMKGIILTAKHHDGFCLWPSKYTEHSVKNSPWKNGRGDVLRELRKACDEYGLKMGIYLSPWDRNNAAYGRPEYLAYFRNQLREVLTQYGDIFEVWFDGANGGTGYYGGANEKREIDRRTYYHWDSTWNLVRKLQPGAVMFSDGGPDIRWVGNEKGFAGETDWSILRRDEVYPGWPNAKELTTGHENGTHWVPAEADVSIRPGWYYHAEEDGKVKTLDQLLDIYYQSVGRNAAMLLNVPADRRGLIAAPDSARLMELAARLKKDFARDLAAGRKVTASEVRLNDPRFSGSKVNDGNPDTYWTTNDFTRTGSLTVDLGRTESINRLLVQEYIRLGQRVQAFRVEAWKDGAWKTIAEETTIGYKRILRFPAVSTNRIRFSVTKSKACPVISNLSLYDAPED